METQSWSKTMPTYALVDGNSFYASCQIAFQPALKNHPVVVLSNNDGCIVAANQIAKDLEKNLKQTRNYGAGGYHAAVPDSMMFQPYFKVAPLLKKHHTVIFSSNYELYADMSQRMHSISAQFASRQEIYSIDESFLDFSSIPKQALLEHANALKQRVYQWIGIPVAVGIGRSKTEAKLANHLAKKIPQYNGVLDLSNIAADTREALYRKVKVGSVWGIGKRLSKQLIANNINTAYDLSCANRKTLRKQFSVNMERTVRELNGEACLRFDETPDDKKNIVSSRSFGHLVSDFDAMRAAVASYTATAAEKLRAQNSVCQLITVWITTPPYQKQHPQYRNQISIPLIYPSDSTILLTKLAHRALKQVWQPGFQYQKASVMLSKIQPKSALQVDLFAPDPLFSGNPKSDRLMQTVDRLNRQMGKQTIQLASSGLQNKNWKMNRRLMSPRYTTRWEDLLKVKA